MKVKLSNKGYKIKPSGFDCSKIQNEIKKKDCKEVDFKQLAKYIEKGYSFVLAEFEAKGSLEEENIIGVECLALDVDSKNNPVNMFEFISLLDTKFNITPVIAYRTFSDADYSKFRLIYQLENKLDTEAYRLLYKALIWKIDSKEKFLDKSTCYPSKLWAGTNKEVIYNTDHKKITFSLVHGLVNRYLYKLEREKKKQIKKNSFNTSCGVVAEGFIKKEYKEEVRTLLIENISLLEFIQEKYGGSFKKIANNYIGRCVLPCHTGNGDNKSALCITEGKHIYTCYSHCGTGNIITLAKMFYNTQDTSEVYLKLAADYNINIPSEWIFNRK
ncbi:MAG: hypothetical protein ACRDDY_02690 [Clostridium sp.]|uniref:hypothetical protein n=1 Tax=Clostridium sp. TaxID=1506 RepID=UPI003EE7F4BD